MPAAAASLGEVTAGFEVDPARELGIEVARRVVGDARQIDQHVGPVEIGPRRGSGRRGGPGVSASPQRSLDGSQRIVAEVEAIDDRDSVRGGEQEAGRGSIR